MHKGRYKTEKKTNKYQSREKDKEQNDENGVNKNKKKGD